MPNTTTDPIEQALGANAVLTGFINRTVRAGAIRLVEVEATGLPCGNMPPVSDNTPVYILTADQLREAIGDGYFLDAEMGEDL